jgi:hypothetical protein
MVSICSPIIYSPNPTAQCIPENNVKDIPSPFRILPIRLRRLNTRRLFAVEQAPIHRLIDAGAFGGNDLPRGGRPLRRLPIDSTRDVFATDSKVTGGDIGIVGAVELLSQLVSTGLQAIFVIARPRDGVGIFTWL